MSLFAAQLHTRSVGVDIPRVEGVIGDDRMLSRREEGREKKIENESS